MPHRLPDAITWLDAPRLGPKVASCLVVTLPAPRCDSPRRRARGHETWLPQRLLFARYLDGNVAAGALLGRKAFHAYDIGAACVAMRDRVPGTRVRTALGTLIAGPDEALLDEFEGTWCDRCGETLRRRPLREVIAVFEARLEQAPLAAGPRGLPARYRVYNWLRRQPADEVARFAQAAAAYPFLWSLLLRLNDPVSATLRERICAAEPIAECLAELLQAQPWQLRALQRAFVARDLDERDLDTCEDLLAFVRALDHLIPERVPATREGWAYLKRAVDQLPHKAWLRGLGEAGLDALGAGKGVARIWRPFARKSGLRRELAALADYYDYAARFPGEAGLPATHATDLRAVVVALQRWRATVDPEVLAYYHDRSCPPWIRRWLRAPWERPAFDDEDLDDLAPDERASAQGTAATRRPLTGAWPPLLAEPAAIDGYIFVELTTAEALREESCKMHHCVVRYASRCERRGARIFSVRTPAGERASTLELCRVAGAWAITQHSAKANRSPLPEVERAAEKLLTRVSTLAPGSSEQGTGDTAKPSPSVLPEPSARACPESSTIASR